MPSSVVQAKGKTHFGQAQHGAAHRLLPDVAPQYVRRLPRAGAPGVRRPALVQVFARWPLTAYSPLHRQHGAPSQPLRASVLLGSRAHLCGCPAPLAAPSLAGERWGQCAKEETPRGIAPTRAQRSSGVRGVFAGRKGDGKKPKQPKNTGDEGSVGAGGRQGSGRQGSSGPVPPAKATQGAKVAAQSKGASAQPPAQSGPRIRSDIGMSMKTQLRLVKAFKEMENKAKTSSKTLVRTGFRRKATVKSDPDSTSPDVLRDIWNQKETPPHEWCTRGFV